MRAAEQKFSQMRLTAVTWERRRAAGRDSWRQARVFFRVDFTVAVKHEVLYPVLDNRGTASGRGLLDSAGLQLLAERCPVGHDL